MKKKSKPAKVEPDYMTLFKKRPGVIYFDVREWHAFPFSTNTNRIVKEK
jgi:hypothetical protein